MFGRKEGKWREDKEKERKESCFSFLVFGMNDGKKRKRKVRNKIINKTANSS